MPCKYLAPNGQPSKLFDNLFGLYKERYNGDVVRAEKAALRTWSLTRSENFKEWFGDWETEAKANRPELLAEAVKLVSGVKGMYGTHFGDDIKDSLRNVAEQINSAGERPKTISDITMKVDIENYRNVTDQDKKMATSGNLDAQRKWMTEEIAEFYEAVKNYQDGGSIDDLAEEVLGLFRTAQQFKNTQPLLDSYMGDIWTVYDSLDKKDQYGKFKTKKTSKGQAADMTFEGLTEYVNSLKDNKVSSNMRQAKETYGNRMVEIALELYPNAKLGDPRNHSMVVDENGEPLPVHHATKAEFNTFNREARNTDGRKSRSTAFHFITEEGKGYYEDRYGTNVMTVFLNIRNPKIAEGMSRLLEEPSEPDRLKLQHEGFDGGIINNEEKEKEYVVFEPNQVKSVDNAGHFRTDDDNIYALQKTPEAPRKHTNEGIGSNFFSLRNYDVDTFRSGKKTMSIRPDMVRTGIYEFGGDYYTITSRGLKKVTQLKESPEVLRAKSIGKEDIRFAHIEEFYKNKLSMYVYDIKKEDEKDYPALALSKDFVGGIEIINRSSQLASDEHVFNKYITAVADYITRLKDERSKHKNNLKLTKEYTEQIKEQEDILSRIESNKSVRALIEIGVEQLADIKRYALKDDASFAELTEGMRITQAWSQLTDILDLMVEGKTDMQLEVINAARDVQADAQTTYAKFRKQQNEKFINLAREHGIEFGEDKGMWFDKENNFRIRDIGFFDAQGISASFSRNPAETLVTVLCSARKNAANDKHYAFMDDAVGTTKRLLGSSKAKTDFLVEEFTLDIIDPETGKITREVQQGIMTMYSRKFYDEYLELKGKAHRREIKWKEFYKFEQQHFSYKLTAEGQKEFDDYMEQVRESHRTDVNEKGEFTYDEEAIEKERKYYDPQIFQDYLNDSGTDANAGARWFTKTPENIPLNPKYQALTASQKEYHEWFSDRYMKAYVNSVFDYRVGQTDIDQLLLDFSNTMTTGLLSKAKYLGESARDFLKDSYTVVATDPTVKGITRPLTGNEHLAPAFKPIDGFLPEHGKIDPLEILKKFVAASISYENKREVEEVLNVINGIVSTAIKQEQTNSFEDKVRKTGVPFGTRGGTFVADRVDFTIKSYLQDIATDPNTTGEKVKPGERGRSFGQAVDSVNKFTRFRYMAVAPLSAAGNLIMGVSNNYIYAADGSFYTDKELAHAMWLMKWSPLSFFSSTLTGGRVNIQTRENKLLAEIMLRYNILNDVNETTTYGESALDKFFALQKGGEYLVQGASCLAQMLHTKLTKEDMKDGSENKTMLDLYKLDENDRLVFQTDLLTEGSKWRNNDEVHKLFDKIKAVNDKIHGDYRNPLLGKKTVMGRVLFLFRTWLPMSVKERFGAEYDHHLLGKQKGRYRSAAGLISAFRKDGKWDVNKDNSLNLVKTLIKMITPFVSRKIKLGGNISDIDRRNIDMFVREIQLMIAITLATMAAKTNADDEDDDETSWFKYLYNQGERLNSELSMYYSPTSTIQILKSIIPLTSTLVDTQKMLNASWQYIVNPEKDKYVKGFRKDDSKAGTAIQKWLPGTRSFQSTWSAFSNLYSQNPRN